MNTKEKLTFSNSIDILQQKKHKRGMMFGLGNMLKILAEFDNPHNNLKIVSILQEQMVKVQPRMH